MIRIEVTRSAYGVVSVSYVEREITEWDIQRGVVTLQPPNEK
jgi:hypothetical protein